MSLLRLLAAGKSFAGMRDSESRYRLTDERLLPQFGPVRNPFSSKRRVGPGGTEVQNSGDEARDSASREASLRTNSEETTPATAPRLAQDRVGSTSVGGWLHWGALRLKLTALPSRCRANLTAIFGRVGAKAAKPAIPRFSRRPVQGELALDKIRVVRNDLSDADLEVVPARMLAASPSSRLALRTEPGAGGGGSIGRKVVAGSLGAGKT
jgi:hypothetical protein